MYEVYISENVSVYRVEDIFHCFSTFLFQRKRINKEEDLLGCEMHSAFPQIQEINDAKEPFDKLWRSVVTFQNKQEEWLTGSILKLNAEEIEEKVVKLCTTKHVLCISLCDRCPLSQSADEKHNPEKKPTYLCAPRKFPSKCVCHVL